MWMVGEFSYVCTCVWVVGMSSGVSVSLPHLLKARCYKRMFRLNSLHPK